MAVATTLGNDARGRARDTREMTNAVDRCAPVGRVHVDGKQFALGDRRFTFRGVTYGTFQPRADGARYPERAYLKRDFEAIAQAGFTVVRTYTAPSDDLIEVAADYGLRVLAGVFYPDWRYLLGWSRRDQRRVQATAAQEVRSAARRLAGVDAVLGLVLGNEVPADVIRWIGADRVADAISRLTDVVREEDGEQLVTYGSYPTAEYLSLPELDFLMFNVYLDDARDLGRYVNRLHHLAGDRPLVLGEIGTHVTDDEQGDAHQAQFVDSQMRVAVECGVAGTCLFSWTDEWWVGESQVEGWRFGLTRADRSERPALSVAARWNEMSVGDLDVEWPPMSVVICAYNAEATLDECLRHTCALEYPDLEILVVDDGSTDGTADIARRHPRARLIHIAHRGLSVARNEGFRAARGALVAYLDADAYPSPEWPYYLALGFEGENVEGVGGPNLPPTDAPMGEHAVAHAPGGPVHVLLTDDRAEHIPGCNMAFRRAILDELGGFDPVFTAAGDDVDLCWRLLDRGGEIAFHPAALVWHRRRPGVRAYLRQQRGYGRSEALVEARHPQRFTGTGSARWQGRIYNSSTPPTAGGAVYRGAYGAAAFQSVYRTHGHAIDLAHQIGVPVATLLALTAPLAIVSPFLAIPAGAGLTLLAALGAVDFARVSPARQLRGGRNRFRASVAAMHLLQPIVRAWARLRMRRSARRALPRNVHVSGVVRGLPGRVLLTEWDQPRDELVAALVADVQRAGVRVRPITGWEPYDARLVGSTSVVGDLITSAHPDGFVQLRMSRRPRVTPFVTAAAAAGTGVLASPYVALALGVVMIADVARGFWRTGPLVRRLLQEQQS